MPSTTTGGECDIFSEAACDITEHNTVEVSLPTDKDEGCLVLYLNKVSHSTVPHSIPSTFMFSGSYLRLVSPIKELEGGVKTSFVFQ